MGMLEEDLNRRSDGEGSTYRESMRRRIPLTDCRVELTDGSMKDHFIRLHGTNLEIDWDLLPVRQIEHLPLVYEVIFPYNMQS